MKIFLIGLLFITALETGVYWHYNHLLQNPQMGNLSVAKAYGNTLSQDKQLIINKKVRLISISDNQQYVAYTTNNNKLSIVNILDNRPVFSTDEEGTIVYLKWIRSDSIFIGLKPNKHILTLKTFQLANQMERVITRFVGVTSTSTFKSIIYSPFTNDVYTLIGNKQIAKLYHFDTNGVMNLVPLKFNYIQNPLLLSTKNDLFYEDHFNTIWLTQNGVSRKIKSNSTLLAAFDDTIYFGTLNNSGNVQNIYQYQNGEKQLLDVLPTPVPGNQILVTKGGKVLYIMDNTLYDANQKEHFSLSKNSILITENHNFFLIKNGKTYLFNGLPKES